MRSYTIALTALLAVIALGGCESASLGSGTPLVSRNAVRVDGSRQLLYVSEVDGTIDVFTYPGGKSVGTLTTEAGAAGLCTDASGDVYVTDPYAESIYEFPHGGVFPIIVLDDATQTPIGCAVDPKTGNLAVANLGGLVQVYAHGRGTPTDYYSSGASEFFFCSYDDDGNLYLSAENSFGAFVLAELPSKSTQVQLITVNTAIEGGSAIVWKRDDLVLQSSDASGSATLVRVKVTGSAATVVGKTTLDAPANTNFAQFAIEGHAVIEPDDGNEDVGLWPYPKGGEPTKTLTLSGDDLIGVTVSGR